MSDQLQLSDQLIQQLFQTLREHDSKCEHELVACQYLAATIGFVTARQQLPDKQKADILNDMLEFIRYVHTDMTGAGSQQQPQAPAPDPAQAFGIWRPDGS